MGEGGHEDDGGVGDDGLEDATVPAGGKAKKEAGEEHRGQDWRYQLPFFANPVKSRRSSTEKWGGQRKPFPKEREKAGGKDEQEP